MSDTKPRVGVLALQGSYREHISCLQRVGAETVEVLASLSLLLFGGAC